ncbi:MAG TPA: hypothetical protein VM536_08170 [Chloroflexia bacterium]|nr:hypothetical protein [Chloroflexia bacterium]
MMTRAETIQTDGGAAAVGGAVFDGRTSTTVVREPAAPNISLELIMWETLRAVEGLTRQLRGLLLLLIGTQAIALAAILWLVLQGR